MQVILYSQSINVEQQNFEQITASDSLPHSLSAIEFRCRWKEFTTYKDDQFADGDIHVASLAIRDAKRMCRHLPGCAGFCHPEVENEQVPTLVRFKGHAQDMIVETEKDRQSASLISRVSMMFSKQDSKADTGAAWKCCSYRYHSPHNHFKAVLKRDDTVIAFRHIFNVCPETEPDANGWLELCEKLDVQDNFVFGSQPGDVLEVEYMSGQKDAEGVHTQDFLGLVHFNTETTVIHDKRKATSTKYGSHTEYPRLVP